ncbi:MULTISPECIES: 50S ribosomal protein L10 [Atopobiaceae]|uniref:50S ribosomal protein L10 n=1 Tax=Atopobiaceae TaxID=1643824 RepID=UPI000B3A83DB|nr:MULTISPECIES: 50S ribosomal protein L10 [Atopobiaceae]MCR8908255.1 50S ribosomal protein L10 [Thermophilibacter sp. ET337]OUO33182.1 50S ribosomal protein L10 [Olsenella sp. An293]
MPSKSNVAMLEKVASSLEAAGGVFVVDYRGLSVKETQEVRRALRAAGAEMKVYKNNIVKIALENAGMPNIDEMLSGTCAYVFYEKDPVDAAKVIKEQSDKLKKMAFVGAIADGKALTADEAKAYADLPNREQLMGQIAGLISGFARGIAVCVNEVPSGLARTISAVSEQKQAA